MHTEQILALILPFEKGLLPMPERAFLMRAEPSEVLTEDWRPLLVCEQSFKPAFTALTKAGYQAVERLSCAFPVGLLLLTKHKVENRANVARAWSLLEPGGVLVCCGANALGAASFEREVVRTIGIEGQLSKHSSRIFWLRRPEGESALPEGLADWLASGEPRPVDDTALVARAGCFSADHVDTGSRILAECFPAGIAGRVADLGAGWGYLGVRLLERFPEITGLDLYEAEAMALADSRTNMATAPAPERATYHWHDVTAGLPAVDPYDWIVSNPPFHEGSKADPAIGKAFITAAWKAIRRRGKFLLVANRHLPYEGELRKRFRSVELLHQAEGFKVYLSTNRHDK
ncbi:MAG: class I SAM-dependent methyltransferase [Rhodospirillaceae bacterium]|nr:class I SAM-dependent methyltransferase [Rhodospirillales bacterium]